MDFKTFLKSALNKDFWSTSKCLCFNGTDFCPLFFNTLFNILDKNQTLPYLKKTLTTDVLKNEYQAELEQGILGLYNFYWLGDLSSHSKNTKLLSYVGSYQGPHFISFFISNDSKIKMPKSATQINIDSKVGIEEFKPLISIFSTKLSDKKILLIDKIFADRGQIELDSACMLINYLELMNMNLANQAHDYLSNIFGVQPALSKISSAFWIKNEREFFKIWQEIGTMYPNVFWVIFWSEQIWKAYQTILFLNQKNFVKAKQASYGLPYSFINKDYNNFKLADLYRLYENLYEIDFAIKKGSTFYSLDLFYLNYFNARY